MASTSLMAPLDVVRFALAYLILIVAPGYAVATLLRPRAPRSERLACAIPCAYALVALSGLATALLRLPFDLHTYGALALPLSLAGGYTLWRQRHGQSADLGRWWLLPAGVALAQVGAVVLVYKNETVPAGFDALAHVTWVDQLARAHIFPIALLSSHLGSTDGGFYPPVFHVLTALVLGVVPMPSYHAVVYSAVATTALLPLALFTYVRTATGSARLGGLAALAALAFEPLPFSTLSLALYPFTVSLLIVPMLAVAVHDAFVQGDRRAALLAAILGIALFYTHPTEFVTVGLLALAIVPARLRTRGAWARASGYGLAIAGAWLIAALPALVAVHRTIVDGAQPEIRTVHDFSQPAQIHLGAVLNIYEQWVYGRNVSYILLAVTLLGVVWCLARRRFLGLALAYTIVCVLFLDSISYNVLRPLYVMSFPWVLLERLSPTHYWFVLPLAALGLDAVLRAGHRLLQGKSALFVAIAAAPLVVLGLLVPFDVAAGRAAAYAYARRVVAPADFGALAWLARHAPVGSVAVNEGDVADLSEFDAPLDAGRWMPVLGGPRPLFWRDGSGPGSLSDRFYLLAHVADSPLPPRAAHFIKQYDVRYVFYGAIVRPGARRQLNLADLLADPRLHLAYSSVAACRTGQPRAARACPTTGSYVFALDIARSSSGLVAQTSHRRGHNRRLPS